MKRYMFVFILAAVLASCSSSPKRPMLVTDISSKANERYETANGELVAGQFEKAAVHLTQAYNLAVSVDASELLCKICFSGIVYKIDVKSLDVNVKGSRNFIQTEDLSDSFLNYSADKILSDAEVFAKRSSSGDILLRIHQLYKVKLELAKKGKDYAAYLLALSKIEKEISKEDYYLGYLYRTKGDIHAFSGDYASAEKCYIEAADIHTKSRYLMEIGLDWYSMASCRSLSGNKQGAREAILMALKYDRDAENAGAIALDYYALSKILLKGSPSQKEKEDARAACLWASEIYEAAGFAAEARECREAASAIK